MFFSSIITSTHSRCPSSNSVLLYLWKIKEEIKIEFSLQKEPYDGYSINVFLKVTLKIIFLLKIIKIILESIETSGNHVCTRMKETAKN